MMDWNQMTATKEALKMIMYDRFDNSAGSTEYKEFHN